MTLSLGCRSNDGLDSYLNYLQGPLLVLEDLELWTSVPSNSFSDSRILCCDSFQNHDVPLKLRKLNVRCKATLPVEVITRCSNLTELTLTIDLAIPNLLDAVALD